MRIESVPVSDFDQEIIKKLARRNHVSERTIARKHVLFVADQPNPSQGDGQAARVVRTAIIVDEPIAFDVFGVGSAIKSPFDVDDASRGDTIAFARALSKD